jgi:hypothetical protein
VGKIKENLSFLGIVGTVLRDGNILTDLEIDNSNGCYRIKTIEHKKIIYYVYMKNGDIIEVKAIGG